MKHRLRERGPDGVDIIRDIDRGPGPVGAVAPRTISGVLISEAMAPDRQKLMYVSHAPGGSWYFNGRRHP